MGGYVLESIIEEEEKIDTLLQTDRMRRRKG